MKIVFLFSGLTHYYNLVLSRLNQEPSIDLIVVIPAEGSRHIGAGVNQTRDGVNFKVVSLKERNLKLFSRFQGLPKLLLSEKPDIVVTIEIYSRAFLFDISLRRVMKKLNIGLILKSIPFRLPVYKEALQSITSTPKEFASLPAPVNTILTKIGLLKFVRKIQLNTHRLALNYPDAHVNYIEAYELLGSYDIEKEAIFVTRNSPDTDLLFSIKEALRDSPPILPPNLFRLLHVGRLVAWKRVDMLIRAFVSVRKNFPGSELVIIGIGPEELKLKTLVDELGLGVSVLFTGGIYEPEELGQYFEACSLYVLAGMGGLSINDAMCFSLPILCSVCDGTEKILVRENYNGLYFKDGSEEDLANKIKWFFDHPDEALRMGENSVKILRKDVNIHTVIKGYIDAFNYVKNLK